MSWTECGGRIRRRRPQCIASSTGGEDQQIVIEALSVSDGQSVRRTLLDFELAAGYEGCGFASGEFERCRGVAVALNNQSGEGNGLQVEAKPWS
jgi:hypothetical protein